MTLLPKISARITALPAILLISSAASAVAPPVTVTLNPTADAFVVSASPDSNYGGAGALSIAAPALAKGQFQTVMRFDASTAASTFNTSFANARWTIQSATLTLQAAFPNNPIFNSSAGGMFGASWMSNTTWVEGTGMPRSPGTTGITFNTLPTFESAADQPIGTFAYDGSTTDAATYTLTLARSFLYDLNSGGTAGIRLFPADTVVAYLFNSTDFPVDANKPALAITATCLADFNGSGTVTVQDIFDFLTAWFAASPRADVNRSGTITVQDIFDFLTAWFAGCS